MGLPLSAGAAPAGAQVRVGEERRRRNHKLLHTKSLYASVCLCFELLLYCLLFKRLSTDRVRPTSAGVWPEGESPSILCGASEWSAGEDGGQGPQPLWCSGGVCRHRAGERFVFASGFLLK